MSDDVPENRLPDSTEDGIASVAGDGNGDETNTSTSPMGIGLSTLISSVIREFDSRADATSSSQDQLSFALDRLTGELDKLLEDAPLPFIMQHAARISGVRKRVTSLNSVLKSIQRRVDNIDRMLLADPVADDWLTLFGIWEAMI
nr:uncharacterized protein LOC109178227 isoform X3 [Ipomoea batatas]